ncbi:MAG TPA: hypothetical protein VN651_02590 [Gemmatimonadaceae bacterium]|nr:hypothetical protein [Gemmatimonadaceae bacterium]
MFAAPVIAALSLFGGALSPRPAAPAGCITPAQTGTYRVVAMKPDSSSARQAMLVLENIDGCLEASLITDDRGPAVINRVVISGDTLRGSVRTESGNGTIELRFTPTEVTGSIVDGRQHWRLAGRRTS